MDQKASQKLAKKPIPLKKVPSQDIVFFSSKPPTISNPFFWGGDMTHGKYWHIQENVTHEKSVKRAWIFLFRYVTFVFCDARKIWRTRKNKKNMMHEKYVHMSIFFVAFYFGSQNFHLSHFFVDSCSVTQKYMMYKTLAHVKNDKWKNIWRMWCVQ